MRRIRNGWIIPTLALLAALAQAGPDQFGGQCCQVLL
jgi:hypothetical protein